jgi:hypothetical protein
MAEMAVWGLMLCHTFTLALVVEAAVLVVLVLREMLAAMVPDRWEIMASVARGVQLKRVADLAVKAAGMVKVALARRVPLLPRVLVVVVVVLTTRK